MGRFAALAGLGLAILVWVPAALAQSPAVSGYGGVGGEVQGGVSGSGSGSGGGGALPFTGLDLGLLVAGGLVLLVAGLTLRRFAHSKH